MRHRLVAAEGKKEKEKKKTLHTCCPSLKRLGRSRRRPSDPEGLLLRSQIKLKQLHSAANGKKRKKKGSAWVSKVQIGAKSRCWPESETALPLFHVLTVQHTHTHTDVHKPLPPSASLSLSLALFLTPPGSEPDIPAGPVSLKWLVGAGSRYRGRDWRKPICLAVENGPGPGVNQQTQYTAHSVHTGTPAHTYIQMQTLPTLSPQRSCNKTSQIWRLRKTATAQPLWSWLAATRIWTLKEESWLRFKNIQGHAV